ncbi:MAG TPA: glutamate-5-semialdehyde dehydrogenase [Candidatus Fraserbacteria bacterium]|nr:glutamate-5-semialdehyde dehydrogenase [Candidatus Fraserbacteria bacterium]
MSEILAIAKRARLAGRRVAALPSESKNRALRAMAAQLRAHLKTLLEANALDMAEAQADNLSAALLDRLRLDEGRVEAMARGLEQVAELPDPVGKLSESWRRPNGLQVQRRRIPLGVIALIYEARPNVTADAAGLCLKSGNAVILRGGHEALRSNRAIVGLLQEACSSSGVPADAIQLVGNPDYRLMDELLQLEEYLDLVIPRGGEVLIRHVSERSRVPVLKHAKGVCHIYVDAQADLTQATKISLNAKVQRPGVCNAMETLLVHEEIAPRFLPDLIGELRAQGVRVRGCERTRALVPGIEPTSEEDWSAEYLDLILSIRVVPDLEAAIGHIERYSSQHTEAIVTQDAQAAEEFLRRVDSSAVLLNASTRFNDGGELGLGVEIGISTTKLHAFGPMGLRELTTTKFVVCGDGQVRE